MIAYHFCSSSLKPEINKFFSPLPLFLYHLYCSYNKLLLKLIGKSILNFDDSSVFQLFVYGDPKYYFRANVCKIRTDSDIWRKGFYCFFFCYMKEFEGKTYFPKQCLKIQHGENMAILQKTTRIRKINFCSFLFLRSNIFKRQIVHRDLFCFPNIRLYVVDFMETHKI